MLSGRLTLQWIIDIDNNEIKFTLTSKIGSADKGYIGIGFGDGSYMVDKDIIMSSFDKSKSSTLVEVVDCYSCMPSILL